MEYIIIFDGYSKAHSVLETDDSFIKKFNSYEKAKEVAEDWKSVGECIDYQIYALCTDERNHLI